MPHVRGGESGHRQGPRKARGLTVRQCAQRLGVSESTVDNHKVRLMKKVRVHRSIDLIWLAIREGLLA